MAVIFDDAGDYLSRVTTVPAIDPFTCCTWFKINTDLNIVSQIAFAIYKDTVNFLKFRTSSNGTTMALGWRSNDTSISSSSVNVGAMTVGTWYFLAFTISGADINVYFAAAGATALTTASATASGGSTWFTPTVMRIGLDEGGNPSNGTSAYTKIWSAALSAADLLNEFYAISARRLANMLSVWPEFNGSPTADWSGNGRTWTENGVITYEAGPPIAWGSGFNPQVPPDSGAAAIVPGLSYSFKVDFERDGAFAGADDELVSYLLSADWTSGMANSYDEFAQPSQLTAILDNRDGAFSPETIGAELVTNGTFAAWTSDDPDSWTVTGEVASDPYVNQVGAGQGQGGAGTGKCNLYTTADTIDIRQTILTAGNTYYCELSVDYVAAGGIQVLTGSDVVSPFPFITAGVKSFYFRATATSFIIRNYGACDVTIDDVTVKEVSLFSGRLKRGLLVRLRATLDSVVYTLTTQRIANLEYAIGSHGQRTVTLTANDQMFDLLAAEYKPTIETNLTIDQAMMPLFDEGLLPYPYDESYWLLGVEGSSELDSTAVLYDHDAVNFETGETTLAFVGDASLTDRGVSAQTFLRDLVAAELGGRFWFDGRTNKFIFHNRHHDILNTTIETTLSASDLLADQTAYVYGEDVINQFTVNYMPREVGAEGTVLWTDTSVPFELRRGAPRQIVARYVDPAGGAKVSAQGFVALQKGFDYIANTLEDGTGEDVSDSILLSCDFGATSATLTLSTDRDLSKERVYITFLQMRGTPLYTYDRVQVVSLGGESRRDFNLRSKTLTIDALGDHETAQAYADFLLSRFRSPFGRFRQVAFEASGRQDLMLQALARSVGDKVTISEAFVGHNASHVIVGERHNILFGGDTLHSVTWILQPAQATRGWLLEVATRSELDQATILAF